VQNIKLAYKSCGYSLSHICRLLTERRVPFHINIGDAERTGNPMTGGEWITQQIDGAVLDHDWLVSRLSCRFHGPLIRLCDGPRTLRRVEGSTGRMREWCNYLLPSLDNSNTIPFHILIDLAFLTWCSIFDRSCHSSLLQGGLAQSLSPPLLQKINSLPSSICCL
jgi:hypothetical protein